MDMTAVANESSTIDDYLEDEILNDSLSMEISHTLQTRQ